MSYLKRREFIGLLGGAAVWPLTARAQQGDKIARIGFLSNARDSTAQISNYEAFLSQMREQGFREGENFIVEYRALTDPRGPFASAADLLRTLPDLILVTGPEVALQAVVGASRAIPVVFLAVQYDPVERGYVASLARPGGNITGIFLRQLELAGKQLEILIEAFPQATRVAVLFDSHTADQFQEAERTAQALNIQLQPLKLEKPPYDFEPTFQRAIADAVLILSSPYFTQHAHQIGELAIAHRLPTMFTFRLYVEAGGLMSYGVDFPAMFRRTADYVTRILKGAKPSDLPIEQAAKFKTVVNLKTAKAIGIELPTSALLRADELIE
jgi:putative tryptophan/tyrosine transport system substrate-binding protein